MTRTVLPFLVLLAACSGDTSTDTPPADTDTDTDSSTQVPDDTAAASTTDTGWECNGWYDCQDCGVAACGAELNACVGSSSCSQPLNNWAACVLDCGNPETCADTFSASGSQAQALRDCTQAACPVECGLP